MKDLEKFYKETVALIDLLESEKAVDRDEKIAEIDRLLGVRDQVIKEISAPFQPAEKELVTKIVTLNEKLASLLTKEKLTIEKDIKNIQHKRESTPKYSNPYESMSGHDGVYYDKRN